MNIRKANIDDIDLLIKLRIDYLIIDIGNLTTQEEKAIRAQLKTYYAKHINQDFIAILAENDSRVMAAAFLVITEKPANPAFITGKTGTLLNVLTYQEYRRLGLATKVVTKVIDEAKQLGISSIDLSATENGRPLYEKLGFKEPRYTSMKLKLV